MHIDVTDRDFECTVTFKERQQVLNITERVRELEYDPESCELPGIQLSPACSISSRFAMLQEVPPLLRNETDQEREGLADDLETVITYFRSLLQDQLEVSLNKGEGREMGTGVQPLYIGPFRVSIFWEASELGFFSIFSSLKLATGATPSVKT